MQTGLKEWPFLSCGNYTLLCDFVKLHDMEGPLYIKDKLIELRQLEQAATYQFNESKTQLLKIKKEIIRLEKLLKANHPN
jgi:hypothetical protein